MPAGLKRFQQCGDLHFVTFSCFDRNPYLAEAIAKEIFEFSLEKMRPGNTDSRSSDTLSCPNTCTCSLSEPPQESLARILQAVKISVAKRLTEKPFWARRHYDFNVYTTGKLTEKLGYMHHNPVARGLAEAPEDWKWSSHQYYTSGVQKTVEIESTWWPA